MRNLTLPDYSGREYGRLKVIKDSGETNRRGLRLWECLCACGNTTYLPSCYFINGNTKSCGCLRSKENNKDRSTKHGKTKTRTYNIYLAMKRRCYGIRIKAYAKYGGRGIVVCDRWVNDFSAFYSDMGDPPTTQHSLDRIDNDGPYSPENCRWATPKQQSRNTRRNVFLTHDGITKCQADWADSLGIPRPRFCRYVKSGMSVEDIVAYEKIRVVS